MAQENEIPDVLFLIGKLVDAASASLRLPPRIDAAGRDPFPEDDLAKFQSLFWHSSMMEGVTELLSDS